MAALKDGEVLAYWPPRGGVAGGPALTSFLEGQQLLLLTKCCGASGKGAAYSGTGVVCRSCYTDVAEDFGDCWPASRLAEIIAEYELVPAPEVAEAREGNGER